MRGGRRHFVHSEVMVWVAADRAVKTLERHPELHGDLEGWRAICGTRGAPGRCAEKGFDPERKHLHPVLRSRATPRCCC